ncbi:hypothetical protein IMZ48_23815 [Candidatus Bathyarchaeota archaeon]|nr:hypothetical protein [Candidatus Bathyarchaeota archaeon]
MIILARGSCQTPDARLATMPLIAVRPWRWNDEVTKGARLLFICCCMPWVKEQM